MTKKMDMTVQSMTQEEQKYAYTQSQQLMNQTGCIGHLRADFGSGEEFYSSWDDHRGDLKTQEFKDELDHVINLLRYDGFLHNRSEMHKYSYAHPEASFGNDQEWGVRVNTPDYAYLMRLNPNKGAYNLYCYCYRRDWLEQHMENARRGIRFIDPHYQELFRIPDGDSIRINFPDGEKLTHKVRYIDDYHVEIGETFNGHIYHICEFAERMSKVGAKVIPLRSSLPHKCFVYVESTDEIGIVERGEMGYWPAGVTPEKGVSKCKGVDYLNDAQGVTKAQAVAMKAGSLCGWETKAADPDYYNEQGELQKLKNGGNDG